VADVCDYAFRLEGRPASWAQRPLACARYQTLALLSGPLLVRCVRYASFDILRGLVKLLRNATERFLQFGLQRLLGQFPSMLRFRAIMRSAVHDPQTRSI
jgi:hypothetical protein